MPHIHELIDFCVSAYIVHEGKVLLIYHKQLQKWLGVGGHIELEEDPDQTLFREIEEETGLKPEDLVVKADRLDLVCPGTKFLYRPEQVDIHEITTTHRHTTLVYYLRSKTDQIRLAEREHDEIRWFTAEELERPDFDILSSVKYYCLEALQELG